MLEDLTKHEESCVAGDSGTGWWISRRPPRDIQRMLSWLRKPRGWKEDGRRVFSRERNLLKLVTPGTWSGVRIVRYQSRAILREIK